MNYHCPRHPKQRAFDTSLLMWRRRFLSGTAFSPADLFASGEDGGWYDPSDLTSMFEGINGSGGNPSVGDPVGVVLDKSQMGGQTAGSYLAANDFGTDVWGQESADWTSLTSITVTGGVASVNYTGTVGAIGTDLNAVEAATGVAYYWTAVVSNFVSASDASIRIGGTGVASTAFSITGAGTFSGVFITQQNSGTVAIVAATSQFDVAFTIRKIPGNHLVAPALIQRPLLQTEGGRYYLDFDGVDDEFSTSGYTAQANPTSLFTAYSTTDTQYIVFASGATSTYYVLAVQQSSSDTLIQSNAGTPSYRFNGTAFTGTTRGDVYTACLGAPTVVGAESVNLTGVLWTDIGMFNFVSGGVWQFSGRWYGSVFIDRALTTAERENLEIYLAAKSGATLA